MPLTLSVDSRGHPVNPNQCCPDAAPREPITGNGLDDPLFGLWQVNVIIDIGRHDPCDDPDAAPQDHKPDEADDRAAKRLRDRPEMRWVRQAL